MKKFLLLASVFLISLTVFLTNSFWRNSQPVAAGFNRNHIIDDSKFDNAGSMSADAIQNFLNGFPNSCLKNLQTAYPNSYFSYGGNVPAAVVIRRVSDLYGINPQVLLATLEKESSVVSGSASYGCAYLNTAMGYDCPDGGGCPAHPENSGFSPQVTKGGWLLKWAKERANGNVNWIADPGDDQIYYYGPMTQGYRQRVAGGPVSYFDGNWNIDGQTIHIDNGPTGSLYNYTPHFHGNELFVTIYERWFGPTNGDGFVLAISDNGNPAQYVVYGTIKQLIPDVETKIAWGLQNVALVTVSQSFLDSYGNGPSLDRLYRINGGAEVRFVDSGKSYTLTSPQQMTAWNFDGVTVSSVPGDLAAVPGYQGNLGYAVKNAANPACYMVDGVNGSGQMILRQYLYPNTLTAWEGDSAGCVTLSDEYFNRIDNAIGTSLSHTKIAYGGNEYQVIAGQRILQPAGIATIYPGQPQSVSTATYNRLYANPATATQFVRSAASPTVYLLDAGVKRPISSPGVLEAWGGHIYAVNLVNNGYVNLISDGAAVNSYLGDVGGQLYWLDGRKFTVPASLDGAYRTGSVISASSTVMAQLPTAATATSFIRGAGSPAIYLLDAGIKKPMPSWQVYTLWNGSRNEGLTVAGDFALEQFSSGATISAYFTNGTTSYIMDNGTYNTVGASVAQAWGLTNPVSINAATISRFTAGTTPLADNAKVGSSYFYMSGGRHYSTLSANAAAIWGITGAATVSADLVNLTTWAGGLTQFVRSSDASDLRIFIRDGNNLFTLQNPNQALTLGIGGQTVVIIPSASISGYTLTNAKYLVSQGTGRFAMDAGYRRTFIDTATQNRWAPNGDSDFMAVSSDLAALMPSGAQIHGAIKGSSYIVYGMDSGQRRHLNPSVLASQYGNVYDIISDWLLNSIPEGSPF